MARPEPPSTLPTDNGEGPSTGTGTSTNSRNRHSRTQFPSLEQDNSFASGSSNGGEPYKSSPGIGLGPPPNIRRSSTQSRAGPSSTTSSTRQHDIRRRVRSVHASGREEESVLGGMSPSVSIRRRTLTTQGLSHKTSRNHLGESVESPSDDIGPGVFSDEYDLCAPVLNLSNVLIANALFTLKAHDGAYLPGLAVNWTKAFSTIVRPADPRGCSARS